MSKGQEGGLSRRTFVAASAASVAALAAAGALAGCSEGEESSSSSSSGSESSSTSSAASTDEAFMSEGKGEHLVCAVTGKLIKIAPAIIADELGYFEEEGCDVEFQTIALADAMASMSIDKLDLDIFGVVPTCSYVSQGSQIYVIGGTVLNGGEFITLDTFDRELKEADDFRGLNIACNREETGQMVLKSYLKDNGLELGTDVEFVYVDNATAAMEGLRDGQNDMYITPNGMGYVYGRDGLKVAGWTEDVVGNYPCCRHNCSHEAYTTKYLSLVDFEIGYLRGYDYYLKNKEETIQMMADYSAEETDYVEASLYGTDEYRAAQDLSPDPYTKAVIEFYDVMKNIDEIDPDTPYSMDEYAVSGVYRKALDTMLEREPDNDTYLKLDSEFAAHNG